MIPKIENLQRWFDRVKKTLENTPALNHHVPAAQTSAQTQATTHKTSRWLLWFWFSLVVLVLGLGVALWWIQCELILHATPTIQIERG